MRHLVILIILLSLPSLANGFIHDEKKVMKFSGEVKKGQTFEKKIRDNLFFRLLPQEFGWTISMGNGTNTENNFAGVVTPPYRGVNNIDIEGWHFRKPDNTGLNEVGPQYVNVPQETREFYFVANNADYQKASAALDKMLWSYSYSEKEVEEARITHDKLSKGHGTLIIRDWIGNNLEIGKKAGMDFMKFDVELDFP